MTDQSGDTAVVVLAAGAGTRVGAEVNKVLLPLRGRPGRRLVGAHGAGAPRRTPRGAGGPRRRARTRSARPSAPHLGDGEVLMVTGGATRHASEWEALRVLAAEIEAGDDRRGGRSTTPPGRWPAPTSSSATLAAAARARRRASPSYRSTTLLDPRRLGRSRGLAGGVQTPQAFRAGRPAGGLPARPSATASRAPTRPAAWSATPTSTIAAVPVGPRQPQDHRPRATSRWPRRLARVSGTVG